LTVVLQENRGLTGGALDINRRRMLNNVKETGIPNLQFSDSIPTIFLVKEIVRSQNFQLCRCIFPKWQIYRRKFCILGLKFRIIAFFPSVCQNAAV